MESVPAFHSAELKNPSNLKSSDNSLALSIGFSVVTSSSSSSSCANVLLINGKRRIMDNHQRISFPDIIIVPQINCDFMILHHLERYFILAKPAKWQVCPQTSALLLYSTRTALALC
jgi:hypothetical protein